MVIKWDEVRLHESQNCGLIAFGIWLVGCLMRITAITRINE